MRSREERERAKQEFMARHPERFGSDNTLYSSSNVGETKTIRSNAIIYIFIIIDIYTYNNINL